MGSFKAYVALTWMVTTVLICSQGAPVTEFFGAPQTIEGDSNDFLHTDRPKKVEEMERFHRTYKNGTVEFKTALSNGHVQYQRISTKIVDGDKVQVYEGYISEQYKDGRYGTRYYAADEKGYRSSSVIVENEPPQLPRSGPYSTSLPREIQKELSPSNDDETHTKPKTLIDNLIELEKDLEEEQLSNLNLGSNAVNENPIVSIKESEILKHQEQEEILDNKSTEEPSLVQNLNAVQTDLPLNLDLPSSTELSSTENNHGIVSEEPESSTLLALGENSSSEQPINGDLPLNLDLPSSTELSSTENNQGRVNEEPELSTLPPPKENSAIEQSIKETNNDIDQFEESSSLPSLLDTVRSVSEEELTGRNLHSSTTSEILSEIGEDVKVSNEEAIDISTNFEKSTEQPIEEATTTTGTILNEEVQAIDEIPEVTPTGTLLNNEVTSTEETSPLDTEVHEPNTGVPEIEEVKTDGETSRVPTYPHEDAESTSTSTTVSSVDVVSNNSDEITKEITEQPSLDVIEDRSTESIVSDDIESNSGLATSSAAPNSEEITSEEPLVSNQDTIPTIEISTEKSSDENSEATSTGTFLNDEVTSTEQPASLNNEAQEPITGVPELKEEKTHAETSGVSGLPVEDTGSESTTLSTVDNISKISVEEEVLTEKTLLESIEDKPTESISPENENNSDLSTSSIAPEIENNSEFPTEKTNKIELSTDLPLEDSKEIVNESQDIDTSSEKIGRSLDFSTELPLAENNSTATTIVEGIGSEEGQNISDASINTKVNEETTDKIDVNTELPESNDKDVSTLTTTSDENNNVDATTEAEVLPTTQKNDLESGSSESSHDNTTDEDSQISTDQPLVVTSSEENSNEENKEKSTEDEASTGLPDKSSEDQSNEEKDSTATIVEQTTQVENLSTTEETDEKTYGVEVELSLPVINF